VAPSSVPSLAPADGEEFRLDPALPRLWTMIGLIVVVPPATAGVVLAVVVWRVRDSAQATFDVEDYESFVSIQSETAVRHLASEYPYDDDNDDVLSLRGSTDAVSEHLRRELQDRLRQAGVDVLEARLSHLAYAPEIAGAMLQRQQAAAIIAARQRIVDGAVGMVEMALRKLKEQNVVDLDAERQAAMVSNLLVVLCGERSVSPVVNTGTLHN
jgi:hypothetical protein